MSIFPIAIIAATLVTISSLALVIFTDWRLNIALFAIQYLGVYGMLMAAWPLPLCTAKLVAGWFSGAVLGIAILTSPEIIQANQAMSAPRNRETHPPSFTIPLKIDRFLPFLVALLMGTVLISQLTTITQFFPWANPVQLWAGLTIASLGFIKVSFSKQTLGSIIGLLCILSGMQIIISPLEASPMSVALWSVIDLGLALLGAYLMSAPMMDGTP